MGSESPVGVVADALSDALGQEHSFHSGGALLPPLLGPASKGTRAKVWSSGSGSFAVIFGEFGHESTVWTTLAGLDALIGDLTAAKVRAEIGAGS